jgi:hypothetical protein
MSELSEAEAAEFEARFFADDDLFREVTRCEDELIDAYIRDELTEPERQRFEHGYLTSPQRRRKMEFARLLLDQLDEAAEQRAPARELKGLRFSPASHISANWMARLSFAAVALLLVAGLSWSLIVNRRLHREMDRMRAEQAETENHLRQQMSERVQPSEGAPKPYQGKNLARIRPAGPDIVVLSLTPGLSRGGEGTKKLELTPSVLLIELQLYLEHDTYTSYSVSVENSSAQQIWGKHGLRPSAFVGGPFRRAFGPLKRPDQVNQSSAQRAKALVLAIPADILTKGDFIVRVKGMGTDGHSEEVEEYRFLIVRH